MMSSRSVLFECVVNVSEGRDGAVLDRLAASAGPALLDQHRDPDHNRTVFTLAGAADLVSEASRALATAALATLDLRHHTGAHPRLGVLDVVPFVPYEPGRPAPADLTDAVALRDRFAQWLGTQWGVPSFLYGPLSGGRVRTLPEIRRLAFGPPPDGLTPDHGPPRPDPRHGASAVGARRVLVAYNVWVSSVELARRVAPLVRGPEVRALGLAVGARAQVSCNLVDPGRYGPARLYDRVAQLVDELPGQRGRVEGGELVGLIPEAVLHGVPAGRRAGLGLSEDSTVESRLPGNP
jgi:glutamate formiminotransferase / 5-formyltetrahydrofolate cyclo-ligase